MNMVAKDAGWRCSELLQLIFESARERVLAARPARAAPARAALGWR